ncbi:GNAT family N-acetyltransferase [Bdellovibrio sp. HCB288]|uniref:GNAT family N-acetyltransferase n=1 Tax=Bdellovibrio sp. HCB288 TaxID=3394355 RepID=UPI0039B53E39
MIGFKKADIQNMAEINSMIVESRSVWNYPAEYAEASLPLIIVDEAFLSNELCYEIHNSGLVGFLSFVNDEGEIFLEHLWIKKSVIKQGIGAATSKFIDQQAAENRWSKIKVFPDPPAEGFYLKCGYQDTGKRIPSRIPTGPVFSIFEKVY